MNGRRDFLKGMAGVGALAGMGWLKVAGAAMASGARLRMGVLSDIHLEKAGDEATLIRALEHFRDHGADAVLIAGDFANNGRIFQAKMLADAWFRVFPCDKAPDGRHVERLFIYGNHCIRNWVYSEMKDDPAKARADGIGFDDNRSRVWDRLFHEEFKPIWMKTVKGIPVIGAHWEERGAGIAIEDFMKEHGREIDPRLPFVYTQHAHPKDTCFGAWAWGRDDGRATRALSPFPNAVAFSGHSHYTLTDERSVWQGAFTSINAGSLRYSSVDYSLRENIGGNAHGFRGENRKHRMGQVETSDGRQGMLVSFFDDHLAIERREFVYGQSLGDDWVVPLPAATKPFSYGERAKTRVAPEFEAGAKVTVREVGPKDKEDFRRVVLRFPAARMRCKCRVFEYEVTAILCEDDVELVQAQRRMMSPDYHLPESRLAKDVEFTFAAEDLQAKGRYRFEVRPLECFGRKGAAISSAEWRATSA